MKKYLTVCICLVLIFVVGYFIGKKFVILNDYQNEEIVINIPAEEQIQKVSENLVSQVIKNTFKYYISVVDNNVTVFKNDRRTVYEYTDIPIQSLPTNILRNVLIGIDIKDDKELYEFLENYSS